MSGNRRLSPCLTASRTDKGLRVEVMYDGGATLNTYSIVVPDDEPSLDLAALNLLEHVAGFTKEAVIQAIAAA